MSPLQLRTPTTAPQSDERVVVDVPGVPGSDPLFEFLCFYGEGAELSWDFSVAQVVVVAQLLPGGARELAVAEDGVVEELEVFEVVEGVWEAANGFEE